MSDTLWDPPGSGATLSEDGQYRYRLTRTWGAAAPATFIMLNPSTADATENDPTIRRCIGFAKSWGCGGIVVVNLYALRSTDPQALWLSHDPVGPKNNEHIERAAREADRIVAAWGAHARADRVSTVLALPAVRGRMRALGLTKAGQPRHPLYVRSDASLIPVFTERHDR